MGFDPSIPAQAPPEIQAFDELDDRDNYSEELSDLVEHLAEQLQVPNLVEHQGNFGMVVPSYDTESDVPDQLADNVGRNEDVIVMVDGKLYRVV